MDSEQEIVVTPTERSFLGSCFLNLSYTEYYFDFISIWLIQIKDIIYFLEDNTTDPSTVPPYDTFCPYPAFVFAIVTLILHWILFPFVLFCECLLIGNFSGNVLSICCCGLGRNKQSYQSTKGSNFSIWTIFFMIQIRFQK